MEIVEEEEVPEGKQNTVSIHFKIILCCIMYLCCIDVHVCTCIYLHTYIYIYIYIIIYMYLCTCSHALYVCMYVICIVSCIDVL